MSAVRGWCPSAHRPMMSGDGLLVRVRPPMARLTATEAVKLCDLAERFGNGMIDVTSRGNLQLRGVAEADHPQLLAELIEAGLVAADPRAELAMTVTPFPGSDGLTRSVVEALCASASHLPMLPEKMGIVVDTGPERRLQDVSGDFRVERSADGLILRADGAELGLPFAIGELADGLAEMATWFLASDGRAAGRMRRHLVDVDLPKAWQVASPVAAAAPPIPDLAAGCLGVAFGQLKSDDLRRCVELSRTVTVTPWRLLVLNDVSKDRSARDSRPLPAAIITDAFDPRLNLTACPGAPRCAQASVATRTLAERIAPLATGAVHVSGCSKGCARQRPAPVTLVGRDGRYDLVENGTAEDAPLAVALSEEDVVTRFRQMAQGGKSVGTARKHSDADMPTGT